MLKLVLRRKPIPAVRTLPEESGDHAVKTTVTRLVIASMASLVIFGMVAGQSKAAGLPDSFADLAEEVSPAVVGIVVDKSFQGVAFDGDENLPDPFGPDSPYREFFERFFGDNFRGLPNQEGPPRNHRQKTSGI